jgi:hypothetical protein
MKGAIGNSRVSLNDWHQICVTFDGNRAKVYLDGKFDYRPGLNPYFWPCQINNLSDIGPDFTVGAVNRSGVMGNFFAAQIGGLAIYNELLTEQQIFNLFNSHQILNSIKIKIFSLFKLFYIRIVYNVFIRFNSIKYS